MTFTHESRDGCLIGNSCHGSSKQVTGAIANLLLIDLAKRSMNIRDDSWHYPRACAVDREKVSVCDPMIDWPLLCLLLHIDRHAAVHVGSQRAMQTC
jgi:hypothetical protein